jgi:hypothetical protein
MTLYDQAATPLFEPARSPPQNASTFSNNKNLPYSFDRKSMPTIFRIKTTALFSYVIASNRALLLDPHFLYEPTTGRFYQTEAGMPLGGKASRSPTP